MTLSMLWTVDRIHPILWVKDEEKTGNKACITGQRSWEPTEEGEEGKWILWRLKKNVCKISLFDLQSSYFRNLVTISSLAIISLILTKKSTVECMLKQEAATNTSLSMGNKVWRRGGNAFQTRDERSQKWNESTDTRHLSIYVIIITRICL